MSDRVNNRLAEVFRKNGPEVRAFVTGQMPSFVAGVGGANDVDGVPVFVFHEVAPERLESQLIYLRCNSYRSVGADELEASVRGRRRGGCEIALAFDDATWTFWAYAFPLLTEFGFRAILFTIPGIIPEDSTPYPNLEDMWKGKSSREELDRRGTIQPLCTWRELIIMHESGIVDIQSHSLTHVRVPISPRRVDFLHPGFRTYLCNFNVPLSILDDPERPKRNPGLGAPVFESAPRLTCRPRFKESRELIETLTGYVAEQGGVEFFKRSGWRKELATIFRSWPTERLGSFEAPEEMESAVTIELDKSRKILEKRLGKEVRHFCYPWFGGSPMADRFAAEAGYRTVHYGPDIGGRNGQQQEMPLRIRRISEEYLFTLPGDGRMSMWSIWKARARRLVRTIGSAQIS